MPFQATLSKGFWLGQYPVTQAYWQAIMGTNPSHFQGNGINCPVENVSWDDANDFCKQINLGMHNSLPEGYRFSLPTQTQWEYACRAGMPTLYERGLPATDLLRAAWGAENSDGRTHPVGEKDPNEWGLHDMHGNVGEWCVDAFARFPSGPATDWVGDEYRSYLHIRGSSWRSSYERMEHASKGISYFPSHTKRPDFGFRLCLRFLG